MSRRRPFSKPADPSVAAGLRSRAFHVAGRSIAPALATAVLAAAVLAAWAPPPAPSWATSQQAQQQPQPKQQDQQQPPPTFRAQTALVRVDVYATAQGQPVLDLTADDFDVREDGAAQTVATFERVVVRSGAPPELRVEPRNLRESLQMAADARTRLFVLYLDAYHVTDEWGWHDPGDPIPGGNSDTRPARRRTASLNSIDRALIGFLDRVIGPDDMVAALTPDMDSRQLTFTRRAGSIGDYLRTIWARDPSPFDHDPEEDMYEACYPPLDPDVGGIAAEMIGRRREEITLRSLRDLVQRLGELRPERKALIAVTEGWELFRPDPSLARPLRGQTPDPPGIYVGPDGKLKTGTDPRTFMRADLAKCDVIRLRLANMDSLADYRILLGEANRANVSFYPVNPRRPGAATPTGFTPKTEMLHDMATSTDGRAIISSFDLDASLRRIADDLSQYYLIGYYTTNPKTDGGYRRITVKVKRPGVDVRARPGYRALSLAEVKASAAAGAATTVLDPETASVRREVAALDMLRADRIVRLDAGYRWHALPSSAGRDATAIWVVGEVDQEASRGVEWQAGGTAVISLVSSDGRTLGEQAVTLTRATRMFSATLVPEGGLRSDTYTVRLVVRPAAGTVESRETLKLAIPAAPGVLATGRPMIERRGPFTGPAYQPTADARLRRQETVRVSVPVAADMAFGRVTARILDRSGKPLPIPVPVSERTDAAGRWFAAEVGLAPLAPGDYAVQVVFEKGTDKEVVVRGIRIVR